MSTERPSCQLALFRIGFDFFEHRIFHTERDQVELIDEQGETILEFSNELFIKDKNGPIGKIHREGDSWVYYERPLQTRVVCPADMDLIKFEVEISKRYLAAQQAALVDSEGATATEVMLIQFERTHLPSGRVWTGGFNASHAPCFADPKGYPLRHIEKTVQELIDRWNRQQPNTWRYRLVLKGNP